MGGIQLDAIRGFVGWVVHFCEEGALGGLGELVNASEDQIDLEVLRSAVMLVMGRHSSEGERRLFDPRRPGNADDNNATCFIQRCVFSPNWHRALLPSSQEFVPST
jgi:hypothetical protein